MKIESAKLNNKALRIVIILSSLLCILVVSLLYKKVFSDYLIIPKTEFDNYSEFRSMVFDFFPQNLPSSAHNQKYYVSKLYMDEKIVCSFCLNNEDSIEIEKFYNTFFNQKNKPDIKDNRVNESFLKNNHLELLREYMDSNNYNFLHFVEYPGEHYNQYYGLIHEDNKNQYIVFYIKYLNDL